MDLQLESGEYFLNEHQRKAKKRAEKQAKAAEEAAKKKRSREVSHDRLRSWGKLWGLRSTCTVFWLAGLSCIYVFVWAGGVRGAAGG